MEDRAGRSRLYRGEDEVNGEKDAECQRICGEAGKRGMHRMAPLICPILKEIWLGKRKPEKQLQNLEKGEKKT